MAPVDIWLVVGVRRWARLMVAELCAVLPADAVVHMQGDPSDAELQGWLRTSGLGMKIQVDLGFPPCPDGATGIAFVVNSAYLHKTSVEDMLEAGYNVVCEKPMSFSRQETLSLIDMAAALGLQLFCTNTYLFASYLDRFKEDWLAGRRFDRVHISWADPAKEVRYGETKGYDSSLPLIYDVLPHIANIALATLGESKFVSRFIEVQRGGSEVSLHYRHGDVDIHIALERNAKQRERTLAFVGTDSQIMLDFSSEPGSVLMDQPPLVPVDPAWLSKPKPIAAMIRSVRDFFEFGKQDPRLSPSASLLGNDLIDCVSESYVDQQVSLLSGRGDLSKVIASPADLDYACKEARSIAARALPYLLQESPLRKLASAANLPHCSTKSTRYPSC
jgi:hypothetical protein